VTSITVKPQTRQTVTGGMNSPLAFFKKDGQRGRSEKKNAAGKNRRQVRQGGMKLDHRKIQEEKQGKPLFRLPK
jgi:hypothetical protein